MTRAKGQSQHTVGHMGAVLSTVDEQGQVKKSNVHDCHLLGASHAPARTLGGLSL